MARRWLLAFSLLGLLAILPTGRHQFRGDEARAQTYERCFPETNLCIEGRIREFWEQQGGLPVFGYPITPQLNEEIEGQKRAVQWFERNRLELHPEEAAPHDVLLGRLGVDALEQQGRNWFTFSKDTPQEGCHFFAETEYNVCEPFLSFWQNHGLQFDGRPGVSYEESLMLFGLPVSEAMEETLTLSDGDSTTLTVQWFERARFEHHPNNPPEYQVQLGLLGNIVRGNQPPPSQGDVPSHQIAFTALDENSNQDVYVCNLTADLQVCSSPRRLTNISKNDGRPTWSPDGTHIAFESDLDGDWGVYSVHANGSGALSLTEDHERVEGTVDGNPSWGNLPIGWRVAFHSNREGNYDIYLVDSGNPTDRQRLTTNPAADSYPSLAPDGTRIAFASTRDGDDANIYIANLEFQGQQVSLSSQITNLTSNLGGICRHPAWSPDGTRILFENQQGENIDIYVVTTDGSGLQNLTPSSSAADGHPNWSPDGEHIVFQSNRGGQGFDIYIMQQDGSNVVQVTDKQFDFDVGDPDWRP